jgi:hypothetical protein
MGKGKKRKLEQRSLSLRRCWNWLVRWGVLVQYNCPEGCPELVEKLKNIVQRMKSLSFSPYPDMEQRIALNAWTRIDKFNEFDEYRVVRFIEAYKGIDHHVRTFSSY